MSLTRSEFEKLADTSELTVYEKLQAKVNAAHEKLADAENELWEFERDWKVECNA